MENDTFVIPKPKKTKEYRRDLLPLWIKAGAILFMLLGILALLALGAAFSGETFDLTIYGLKTDEPLSKVGLFIIGLFVLKGIAAFGLWTEKDWAINIAKSDAWLGATICAAVIAIPYFTHNEEMKAQAGGLLLQLMPLLWFLKKINDIGFVWELREAKN